MKRSGFPATLVLITMLTSACGELKPTQSAERNAPDSAPVAAANAAVCSGAYANTIAGTPVAVNLTPSTDSLTGVTTLSGTMLYGGFTLGMGGFVDSSNRCFVWTWYNSLPLIGSGALAGKVTETTSSTGTSTATFDFGGGQSRGGIFNQIVLPNLQKTASQTGTTTPPSAAAATVSYAGAYTGSFLGNTSTIILTQTNEASGTNLAGTLTLNQSNITLNVGGFVDANNDAYVWAWYNNFSNFGSGVVAGKLTKSLNGQVSTGTFDFGGGQSTAGIYNRIVLGNFAGPVPSSPVSYAGTYNGTIVFSKGGTGAATLNVTQTGSNLTVTVSSPYFATVTLSGTVSGNTVTLIVPANSGCGGSINVSATLSGTTLTINGAYPAINSGTCVVGGGTVSGVFTKSG